MIINSSLFFLILLISFSCSSYEERNPPDFYKVSVKTVTGKQLLVEVFKTDGRCPFIDEENKYHDSCLGFDKNMMFSSSKLALEHSAKLAQKKCGNKKADLVSVSRDKQPTGKVINDCSGLFSNGLMLSSCDGKLELREKTYFTFECSKDFNNTPQFSNEMI